MPLTIPSDQAKLKALIERRHPEYAANKPHWDFLEETYTGGREWFQSHIFRYIKEGEKEFAQRVERAYRFNHTREVVDLLGKYIFKAPVIRSDDAPELVKKFWASTNKAGTQNIDQFMALVNQRASTLGRIWVCVDNNKSGIIQTKADEKALNARTYAYIIKPQNILDLSRDSQGNLQWILVQETFRDDEDPFTSSGDVEPRYRLWTTNEWALFRVEGEKNKKRVVLDSRGETSLGEVPIFNADHAFSEDPYTAPALINDTAYLDRAVANYLSNLDAIIQDQTFSQLAMPVQANLPGDEIYDKLLELGTKRVFMYDGEGGAQPMYLSPDPKQAALIVSVVNKIIGEIYHTIGMAGERTKQDNVTGIDNASGVAKAYDFERLNSLLVAKADNLEAVESKLIHFLNLWNGVKDANPAVNDDADSLVKYPDSFDVRSVYDEFDVADRLALIEAPDSLRQENLKSIIDKLYPRLAKDLKDKMLSEVKDWPADPADDPNSPANMAVLQAQLSGGGKETVSAKESKQS
jgi:hypothetical protein